MSLDQVTLSRCAALLLAACAGCDATASCPDNTKLVGTYAVTYAALDGGDTCVVTSWPDGGPASFNLAVTPAAASVQLCAGGGADGGTAQLWFGNSQLGGDGGNGFVIGGSESTVSTTYCICPIDIGKTLSLTVATPDGGPFTGDNDGGFVPINSFTGRLDQALSATSGSSTPCHCNLPCGAHYSVAGKK